MSFEQRLHAAARHALAQSSDSLPPEVLAQLAQLRSAALATAAPDSRNAPAASTRWAPSFAVAATLLLTFAIWNANQMPPLPVADPLESRAAADMELLDELEFVAWMEMQESTVGAARNAG